MSYEDVNKNLIESISRLQSLNRELIGLACEEGIDQDGIDMIFDFRIICSETLTMINMILDEAHLAETEPNQKAIDLSEMMKEWAYPTSEERYILQCITNYDMSAIHLFKVTLDNLYILLQNNITKADIIVKKFYDNIITAVYQKYEWLHKFVNSNHFHENGFLHEVRNNIHKEFYCKRIASLVKIINKLHPNTKDHNIQKICDYILTNPESDLKLKIISEIFFMNNTYLSNVFFTKTGIHYSDYVTLIKMTRAEYLLRNTNLKTFEITYQLGYRDINYFLKQFKKVYGYNITQYRNMDFSNYQF